MALGELTSLGAVAGAVAGAGAVGATAVTALPPVRDAFDEAAGSITVSEVRLAAIFFCGH